jgi:hypothetical protein
MPLRRPKSPEPQQAIEALQVPASALLPPVPSTCGGECDRMPGGGGGVWRGGGEARVGGRAGPGPVGPLEPAAGERDLAH